MWNNILEDYSKIYKGKATKFLKVKCNSCGNIFEVFKTNYTKSINNYGEYLCKECSKNINRKPSKLKRMKNSYYAARQRCNNENSISYKDYGGRGIKVEWNSFAEFYTSMWESWFDESTLEREDVDGNYCEKNCKWVCREAQARNTRKNIHTANDIKLIRKLYKFGWYDQNSLALLFKDSQGNISNIITNKVWKL